MSRFVDVRSIVIEGLSILIICTFIELGAGLTLQEMEKSFVLIPGLAIMALPLLDLRGNINGALASRLGTALHTGIITPKMKMTKELKANLVASLILSLAASATIGGLSWVVGAFMGLSVDVLRLTTVAILAGFISAVILALLTVAVSVFAYVRGWDPDNVTSPMMSTIGDLLTTICIYLAVLVVG